jgi:hypothetical protein
MPYTPTVRFYSRDCWSARAIALTMEAARTSETSVDIQLRTRQYISEDSELHSILLIQKWQITIIYAEI